MDYQKAYADLMLADRVNLRERIVMEIYRSGHSSDVTIAIAQNIVDYIEKGMADPIPEENYWKPVAMSKKRGRKPGKKRRGRPPKIETVVLAKTKRPYTKRSPKWKK